MSHPYANSLIYAADLEFPEGASIQQMQAQAQKELDTVCTAFEGLGITIKGNTLFRSLGLSAFTQLCDAGCRVFADYKLFDVQSTCKNEASWIRNIDCIEILTVNIDVSPKVFDMLAHTLPATIIAPVKPLTDLTDQDFKDRGETDRRTVMQEFFLRCMEIPCNGSISSPKDLPLAPWNFKSKHTVITPGVRPGWSAVASDTNAVNALTHQEAILAGADRLVIGGPVRFQGKMRENARRILDENGETFQNMSRAVR